MDLNEVEQRAYRRKYREACLDAPKRGLSFELSETEYIDLSQRLCTYCESPPGNQLCINGTYRYGPKGARCGMRVKLILDLKAGGIDRVDPRIGYVLSNCVPCCWSCNLWKSFMPWEEWTRTSRSAAAVCSMVFDEVPAIPVYW